MKDTQIFLYHRQSNPSLSVIEQQTKEHDSQELHQYVDMIEKYPQEKFTSFHLPEKDLQKHQIRYINNKKSLLLKQQLKLKKTDCFFSIVQTQFYGLQYTYEILIGPFILRIHVLNLNRNSDDGDEDISKQQIGSGGFGSVRLVRINNQQFAIKRIPFKFKVDQEFGYDLQAENSEQYQLRRCLRQFCMFKICSLLGIGPKLVQSSYDLICFNNCIQFRMELCQSLASNQFYINHQQLSITQIQSDLQKKLIKLHSLNIVHRDIKPQNLLYSPQRKQIVFGDFGMSMVVKESFKQKTLTKFAGTLNYCSKDMRELINGQQGYVNLFLNDYYSLKETLKAFQSQIVKQDSVLSKNNLSKNNVSFGQSNSSLSDFQNFSINDTSNGSFRNQTDISYLSTQSLVNFPTTSTQAPRKLATAINHHESEIIYMLCRQIDKRIKPQKEIIFKYIEQKIDSNQNKPLIDNLVLEIGSMFFQSDNQLIGYKFKQWKNASRHYGPSSSQAISIIDSIISQSEKDQSHNQLVSNLKRIKEQLAQHQQSLEVSISQLVYYRSMGHFQNYMACLVTFIRFQLNMKEKKYSINPQLVHSTAIFIAKSFLFCIKNRERNSLKMKQIALLVGKYFYDARIFQDTKYFYFKQGKKYQKGTTFAQFIYSYLLKRNMLQFQDLACYASYLCDIFPIATKTIDNLIQRLQVFLNSHKDNVRMKIYFYHVSFKLMSKQPQALPRLQKLLRQILQILQKQKSIQRIIILIQLMILFLRSKSYDKIQLINKEVIDGLNQNQQMLVDLNYYHIVRLKIMGQCFIHDNMEKSQQYYKQALNYLQSSYGYHRKAEDACQILNNLAFIYSARNNYKLSLQYLQSVKVILQEINYPALLVKKIYVNQQIITLKLKYIGIQSQAERTQLIELIKLTLVEIAQFAPTWACSQPQIIGALSHQIDPKERYLLEKEIVKFLRKQKGLKIDFNQMYLKLNFSVSKYLIKQMKMRQQGMKYLCNYVHLFHSSCLQISENDYYVFNGLAYELINSHSFRRASIFMKKYIFKIPISYTKVKTNAFKLMYKACSSIEEKNSKLYYQLTKNNCSMLFTKNHTQLIAKQKSFHKKILLTKWLQKI